jgi:hypothetical protein
MSSKAPSVVSMTSECAKPPNIVPMSKSVNENAPKRPLPHCQSQLGQGADDF